MKKTAANPKLDWRKPMFFWVCCRKLRTRKAARTAAERRKALAAEVSTPERVPCTAARARRRLGADVMNVTAATGVFSIPAMCTV